MSSYFVYFCINEILDFIMIIDFVILHINVQPLFDWHLLTVGPLVA